MSAVVEYKEQPLQPAVTRRGITEPQWRTLMNNLFPGAKGESVLMVWDYCVARKLDPLKKPCHIVPMRVKNGPGYDDYVTRDVVMPGIYEYRTTATRTGQYLGHSKPVYGPEIEFLDVKAPEYCELTVYRWNSAAQQRCEFPVMVYFRECAATTRDYKTKELKVNDRWTKAPRQMLTKCTEAAGLREAFPDELGGEPTAEEMEGQSRYEETEQPAIAAARAANAALTGDVDWELRDRHVSAIADILNADKDEVAISRMLNEYTAAHLCQFPELYLAVTSKMKADGLIKSKAEFHRHLEVAKNFDAREAPPE
jgi:phage recombination protein Bet